MPVRLIGILQIIGASLCWGCLGLLTTRLAGLHLAAAQIAALRIVGSLAVLVLLLPWLWPYLRTLKARQLPFLALQSMLGMLGMTWFYFGAVTHAGSAVAVALLYTAPLWSLVLARLILAEPIYPVQALLTLAAALGVALTMTGGAKIQGAGLLLGLGSGLCYALYGILGKRAMLGTPPPALLFTSIAISAGALLTTPLPYGALALLWQHGGAHTWVYAAGLVFLGTLVPYFLFVKGLEKMPAAQASVFTIIEPLTAVLLAVAVLDEHLSAWQIAGVAMIIGAAVANALLRPRALPNRLAKAP